VAEETHEALMSRLYPMGLEEARKASQEFADQEMMADVYRRTDPLVNPSGELGILPYIGATRPSTYEEGPAKYKTLVVGPTTPHHSGIAAVYYGKGNPVNEENEVVKSTGYDLPSQALIEQGFSPLKPEEIYLQQFTPDYLDARIQTEKRKGVQPADLEERRADPVFKDPAATLLHEFFHRAVDSPWYPEFQKFTEENLSMDDVEAVNFPKQSRANNENMADTIDEAARSNSEASPYNKQRLKRIDGALREFFTPERQEIYGVRLPLQASQPEKETGLMDIFTTISAFIPSKIKELFKTKTNEDYFRSSNPMADGGPVLADPYVPGLAAARSVYDQGIAPLAQKVQGFLKGTAGLPGTVKDYALETIQSEGGPTTKVMADLLTLGQGMRQGLQDDPLRFMAEMNPLVGGASDLFETNQVLNLAQTAEESGDLEKAQTLRELANTIVLMGMVPGGPPAKKTLEQKLKDMEEKRRKLTEETGLPYVPSNKPDPGEGRRIDINESPQDTALRKELEDKRLADIELNRSPTARAARATEQGWSDEPLYHGTAANIEEFDPSLAGSTTNSSSAKLGTWLTSDPTVASGYARFAGEDVPISRLIDEATLAEKAGNFDLHEQIMSEAERLELSGELVGAGGQNVMPLRVRGNLMEMDAEGQTFGELTDGQLMRWATEAKKQGYDGLKVKNFSDNPDWGNYRAADHYLIFEPKNIRSVNADFDPARMHEADLQAGIASLGAREGMA
tara:strand:- start:4586 stop:6799 length:2214 start_codon:yes stop_codon:yes gene_type:complete